MSAKRGKKYCTAGVFRLYEPGRRTEADPIR